MGRKATPFPHLQFMAQSVPPPQIVIILGNGIRPLSGAQTWMYRSPPQLLHFNHWMKLTRQVGQLGCWAMKVAVGEYHQPKCNTISYPQPWRLDCSSGLRRSRQRAANISRAAAFWTDWSLSTSSCGKPKSIIYFNSSATQNRTNRSFILLSKTNAKSTSANDYV